MRNSKGQFVKGTSEPMSEITKQKMSKLKIGELNPAWKGEKVKYNALHDWVKWHFPKPNKCSICKEEKSYLDIANISQEYKRDLADWEWLCRKCHMVKDGRMEKMLKGLRLPNLP